MPDNIVELKNRLRNTRIYKAACLEGIEDTKARIEVLKAKLKNGTFSKNETMQSIKNRLVVEGNILRELKSNISNFDKDIQELEERISKA